jgi:aerotaxis receptor
MARYTIKPINQERDFRQEELFFSTTDRRGVIRSGNAVFARVAGYGSVEELIGKPHNIIRHPDMPRAVFRLMWNTIQENRLFAGYVKNLATDGRYYWVMALVLPLSDGYLSVRFKPSSPHHDFIRNLYAGMLEIERKGGEDREGREQGLQAAAERMAQVLHEEGYESYEAFIQAALAIEFASRNSGMAAAKEKREAESGETSGASNLFKGGISSITRSLMDDFLATSLRGCEAADAELDRLFYLVEDFFALNDKLIDKSAYLRSLASRVHLLSLNALVESNRLEEDGLGLTVISDRMAKSSDASVDLIKGMNERIAALVAALREMAFAIASAKLVIEMALFFGHELIESRSEEEAGALARSRMREDLSLLIDSFSRQTLRIQDSLRVSKAPIDLLKKSIGSLEWEIRSLNFIHMAGKIEAVRIEGAQKFKMTFEEAFKQIAVAQEELKDFTSAIATLVSQAAQIERVSKIIGDINGSESNRDESLGRESDPAPETAIPSIFSEAEETKHSLMKPAFFAGDETPMIEIAESAI